MISVLTCLFALVRVVSAEVCSPTQCIPGTFNTTPVGASFSSVILLPGTYSSDSAASKLVSISDPPSTPSGIITSNSSSFPYTVSLSSGALAFGANHYVGDSTLVGLSSNLSSPRLPASVAVPPNIAVTFRSASSQSSLVIFASVPDTAQLPLTAPDLTFSAVQSTSCSPACASGGACTANGTCACAQGFSGSQCEQCAPGFFGPTCQKCQDACCDDGMAGSGKCLGSKNKTSSDICGCDKGTCGSDGRCTCNAGWASPTSGQNSTVKCSVCAPGFFQDASGECQGCTACASPSGVASLQPALPLRPAPTANFSTLRLRLAPHALPYARLVLGPYQSSASRVGPANLWAQGVDVLLSVRVESARVQSWSRIMPRGYAMLALQPVLLAPSHPFLSFRLPPRSPAPLVFQASYSRPLNDVNVPVRQEPLSVPKMDSRVLRAMDLVPNAPEMLHFALPVREVAARWMGSTEDVSRLRPAAHNPFSTRRPERVGRAMPDVQVAQERADKCVPRARTFATSTKTTTTVGLSPLHGALVGTSSIGFLVIGLLFWRRRARKQRAERTAAFADNLPDHDAGRGKWEWGRVWRMRREEGWFSGLKLLVRGMGSRRRGRRQFHREMSLRKLGGQGRRSYKDAEEDPRWRNLHPRREAPDTFVFDRPVVPAGPGTGKSWWRDQDQDRESMDSERGKATEGVYGKINPESHFARTLSSVSGGSVRRPVIQRSETPEAERMELDMTGASAHTFGVAPTIARTPSLGSQKGRPVGLASNPTGSSISQRSNHLALNHTGSDIQAGNWMLPDHTGMESVPSHFTGSVATQNTGFGTHPAQANSTMPLVGQQTGISSVPSHLTGNSSVVFHHTGSSNSLSPHPTGASILVPQAGTQTPPRAPLAYAPFLESSINPQPRQPIRDGSNINPFSRTLTVTPRPSNEMLMMSPPPHGIPSSPVWPGAVGGSYWYGPGPQGQQSQLKLGDKNPFRRI
ncbi:EGF domain, unclasssified subfamily, partial [Rhizoctonia solani]